MTIELSERDRALLDIFGKTWLKSGPKETAIREATGLSVIRATQEVNRLIDTEASLAYAPLTTKRLQRVRARRQLSRQASRRGR